MGMLKILDPANETTVLFDFDDPTGAANPSGLKTRIDDLDLGEAEPDETLFSPAGQPGAEIVYRELRPAVMTFLLRIDPFDDIDDALAGVRELLERLEAGGVMSWQPHNATDSLKIDFLSATGPGLFRGQNRGLRKVLLLLQDPDGLPLAIRRQPYLRGATTELLDSTISLNPTTALQGQGKQITVPGEGRFPARLLLGPGPSGAKVREILVSATSRPDVADLLSETGWARLDTDERGWDSTLENNTSSVAEGDAVGGSNAARIDGASANVGQYLRRVRITRSTKLPSLRGWNLILARVKASAAGKWILGAVDSPGVVNPALNTHPTVEHDVTDATTFGYVEIPLGFLKLSEHEPLTGVTLELWAQRVSGSGNLFLDIVRLLPATPDEDILTRILVPAGAEQLVLGSALTTPPYKLTADPTWTAGIFVGTELRMGSVNNAGGVGPNTGTVLAAGRYRIRLRSEVEILNPLGTGTMTVKLRVVSVTGGGGGSEIASISKAFSSPQNIILDDEPWEPELEFDAAGGTAYQVQMMITAASSGSTFFRIKDVTLEAHPFLALNEHAHTDPERREIYKYGSDGGAQLKLRSQGVTPARLRPPLAALFAVPLDLARAGYSEPESVKARTLTVVVEGEERVLP